MFPFPLEKAFLTLLFSYFFVLWAMEHFLYQDYTDPLDLYFLLSHFFFFGLSWFLVSRDGKSLSLYKPEQASVIKWALLLIIYGLALFLKFEEKVVWLDEHLQFIFGSHLVKSNIIDKSLYQHQPPLDYLLMGSAKRLLGISAFSVKFHAIFFGAGTLLLLPRLSRAFFPSFKGEMTVAYAFALSPFFINYSLEGRPISLTLFSATLFLVFLKEVLDERKGYLWLLLSSFLLLSSTSLQPQIFIFTTLVMSTIFFWREQRFNLLLIGLVSALWRLPMDFRVYAHTRDQFVFLDSSKPFLKIVTNMGYHLYFFIVQNNELLVTLIAAGIVLCFYAIFFEKRKTPSFILSLTLGFLFLYSILWDSFINSVLNPRYNICAYPLIYLLVVYLFKRIEEKWKIKRIWLNILIITLSFISIQRPLIAYSKNAQRPNWKEVYSYLNQVADADDIILNVEFGGYSDFRGEEHTGAIYYGDDEVQMALLDYQYIKDWIPPNAIYFDEKRDYQKQNDKVFLLIDRWEQKPEFWEYEFDDLVEVKHFGGIDILSFNYEGSLYESISKVFREILLLHGVKEETTPFLESLIFMEHKLGHKKQMRSYIDLYESLSFETDKNRRGFILDKESEHKIRMETFKKLLKD